MPKNKRKGGAHASQHGSKVKERAVKQALKKERKAARLRLTDKEFVNFNNQLQVNGLVLKDVLGDGNCLFRALSDQLNGGATSHEELRDRVVSYMRSHRRDFEVFLDEEDESFDKYIAELSKLGTYGGNDSIVAFARLYSVDVVIHQHSAPRLEIHGGGHAHHSPPQALHIAYLNGEHYCSVRPLDAVKQQHAPVSMPTAATRPTQTSSKSDVGKKSGCHSYKQATHHGYQVDEDEDLQRLMELTDCKDYKLAQQCLLDNYYSVDQAVPELILLLQVTSETDGCDLKECKGSPLLEPTARKPKTPSVVKMKSSLKEDLHHLSNKKRKELVKQERKARRLEEKKESKENKGELEITDRLGAIAI